MISTQIAKTISLKTKLVKVNDDQYELYVIVPVRTSIHKFTIGLESEHVTAEGRKVRSKFEIHGNKLIEEQFDINQNKIFIITREFFDDEMVAEIKLGDFCCKQKYKLI